MSNTNILTNKYRTHLIRQISESISETANTAYYVFVAEHIPRSNAISAPTESMKETVTDAYRNMIFGKRISSSDVREMIRYIEYETNKAFDMYDDQDENLFTKDFFCVTNEGSYYHVYKCLDNNMGANSTSEPTFAHITGANTQIYRTADGYAWKYMYSVSSTIKSEFATTDYFPVVANSTVESSATSGRIDVIKIDVAGKRYDNYVTGSFATGDIRVNGNTILYKIGNTTTNQTNGFYTGCLLYISSGTGSGQYRTITDYFTNGNGNFMVVNSAFNTSPVNGSEYQVYPEVVINGDGRQTANAVARALVNALSTNSIYKVEVLDSGNNYSYYTSNVIANTVVGVTQEASLRAIYSPAKGHGNDAGEELGSRRLMFRCKFSNTEANTIPANNYFQKIGLMKDPMFANVNIEMKNSNGTFLYDEQIYKINPVRLTTNATCNVGNTELIASNGDFEYQFTAGDYVYLKSSNGTSHQLATVNSVTNSSHLVLGVNAFFSCTEVLVYSANVSTNAYVLEVSNTTNILLTNVAGVLSTNDTIIGFSTGALAQVNAISRNDEVKDFNTFVQMYKYTGTLMSNGFIDNEKLYQGANVSVSTANAYYHSSEVSGNDITFFVSNQVGVFNSSIAVYGSNSLSSANIINSYTPELVYGSGEILYLENVEPVERQPDESEVVKIILEF